MFAFKLFKPPSYAGYIAAKFIRGKTLLNKQFKYVGIKYFFKIGLPKKIINNIYLLHINLRTSNIFI